MFYNIFTSLCEKKGVKPSVAAQQMGIDKSSVSKWKAKGLTPRADTLNRIAEYFGVPVGYLTGDEPANAAGRPEGESDAAEFGKQLFAAHGDLAPEDYTQDDLDDIAMVMRMIKRKKENEK